MLNSLLSVVGTVVSIIIGVLAVGIVVATIIVSAIRKKQGKTGCSCGCANCSHACHCNDEEETEN